MKRFPSLVRGRTLSAVPSSSCWTECRLSCAYFDDCFRESQSTSNNKNSFPNFTSIITSAFVDRKDSSEKVSCLEDDRIVICLSTSNINNKTIQIELKINKTIQPARLTIESSTFFVSRWVFPHSLSNQMCFMGDGRWEKGDGRRVCEFIERNLLSHFESQRFLPTFASTGHFTFGSFSAADSNLLFLRPTRPSSSMIG